MQNNLWDTLDRLEDGKKWHKGKLCTIDQNRCILGAIFNVQSSDSDSAETEYVYKHANFNPDVKIVLEIIKEQFPEYFPETVLVQHVGVVRFNDHSVTTFEDVRMVLEKAAIKQDEML